MTHHLVNSSCMRDLGGKGCFSSLRGKARQEAGSNSSTSKSLRVSSSALIPPGIAHRQREGPSLGSSTPPPPQPPTPRGTHLGHCYSSWHWRRGAGDLAEWNGIQTSAGRCFFPTCSQFPFLLCFPKAGSFENRKQTNKLVRSERDSEEELRSAISSPLPSCFGVVGSFGISDFEPVKQIPGLFLIQPSSSNSFRHSWKSSCPKT